MAHMKPICVPCQRFFRMQRSGFYFLEGMPKPGDRPAAGTAEPERWTPYKLWSGDIWKCEGCGAIIISGTGQAPVSEHYMPDFPDKVERLAAQQRPWSNIDFPYQVNDC